MFVVNVINVVFFKFSILFLKILDFGCDFVVFNRDFAGVLVVKKGF